MRDFEAVRSESKPSPQSSEIYAKKEAENSKSQRWLMSPMIQHLPRTAGGCIHDLSETATAFIRPPHVQIRPNPSTERGR